MSVRGHAGLLMYAYFGATYTSDVYMVLDDPVRGELDSTYTLAGTDGDAIDITAYVSEVSIARGRRNRLTDVTNPGVMVVTLRNESRYFDPNYVSSPFYGGLEPGRRVDLKWTDSHHIFSGAVESWDYGYDTTSRLATATMTIVDALGLLAHSELAAHTATSQLPGARVSAVLDRLEVVAGVDRYISTGESTLQADVVDEGTNVLGYLQNVARSDYGYFFATRWGRLSFYSRTLIAQAAASPLVALADDGTGDLPYHGMTATVNSDQLFGRVVVERVGGTAQVASNAASTSAYGWRSLTIDGLLLNADADAMLMATYLANRYGTPVWRFQSITLNVNAFDELSTEQYLCAILDIGYATTVTYTPPVGDPVTQTVIIEGMDRTISAQGDHTVTLWLGDFDALSLFILDDTSMGVLDTSALAF